MRKTFILAAAASALALSAITGCHSDNAPTTTAEVAETTKLETTAADWREEYAYTMGVAALHYAYPYWRMAQFRYDTTQLDVGNPAVEPNRMLNQFWHSSELITHDWKDGGAPNNDTLYSFSWIHVADEPMILSIPKVDRFHTFQISSANSDNFTYVGEFTHGRKAGAYALLPQDWEGELPEGVTALAEVTSPWVLIFGRTFVAGEADIPAVQELQAQYQLTALSQWGKAEPEVAQPAVFKPHDTSTDPLAVWKTINQMLTENPPVPEEKMLIKLFQEIQVGPGLDVESLDDASKRGLARAAEEGMRQIKAALASSAGSKIKRNNGWIYLTDFGRTGLDGDFFSRTVWQSHSGLAGNDREQAIYYATFTDSDNGILDGSKRYQIKMPNGSEPDVSAFWSITMYDMDANLVPNEAARYSIGDRTPGLVRDEQGGLTLSIQNELPEAGEANWLPSPKEGPFWIVLRAYLPGETMLKDEWPLPVVSIVE